MDYNNIPEEAMAEWAKNNVPHDRVLVSHSVSNPFYNHTDDPCVFDMPSEEFKEYSRKYWFLQTVRETTKEMREFSKLPKYDWNTYQNSRRIAESHESLDAPIVTDDSRKLTPKEVDSLKEADNIYEKIAENYIRESDKMQQQLKREDDFVKELDSVKNEFNGIYEGLVRKTTPKKSFGTRLFNCGKNLLHYLVKSNVDMKTKPYKR